MRKKRILKAGNVYYLKDFTSPKVFNGVFYECLLTDQRTPRSAKIHSDLGSLKNWAYEIWEPERFDSLKETLGLITQ